ncbi:unnamed protein product [Somion occarium]|uniref:Protein kinase domain-containing protein n=1 Tax=Somion occarium TaxID=3059160 RepID=A0ABP1DXT8_9APHY
MIHLDRTRDNMNPLLRRDLEERKTVNLDIWIQAVTGRSPETIRQWSDIIRQDKFCTDAIIDDAVTEYCALEKHETYRYRPWCQMANRILSLARKNIESLPPYAYADVQYYRNDPIIVEGNGRWDEYAHRKPDVVSMRKATFDHTWSRVQGQPDPLNPRMNKLCWPEIVSLTEFKDVPDRHLVELEKTWHLVLEAAKGRKGELASLEVKDMPPRRSPRNHAASTSGTGITSTPADIPRAPKSSRILISAGQKRKNTQFASQAVEKKPRVSQELEEEDKPEESTSSDPPKNVVEQVGSYALEMLASTHGTRLHSIIPLIQGSKVQFWYADASGFVVSTEICWISNFDKFAALLVALNCCTEEDMGLRMPGITLPTKKGRHPSPDPPLTLQGATLTMEHPDGGNIEVTMGEEIFTQYSLVGRRTNVYNIKTSPGVADCDLVIKMSFQPVCRHPEQDILRLAENAGVEHIPKAYIWTNQRTEWRLSNGIRGRFWPDNSTDQYYDERSFRWIIFKKYYALEKALDPLNMGYLFRQLLDCVNQLRTKACILHRDISLSNLMYDIRDGTIYLILNDFDLSSVVDQNGEPTGATARHRTGTLPFIAVDLLHNPDSPHYVRHDIESIFYVATWCAIKLPLEDTTVSETQRRRAQLQDWELHGAKSVARVKIEILHSDRFVKLPLSDDYAPYLPWLYQICKVMEAGQRAITDRKRELAVMGIIAEDSFNAETCGGHITYENVKKAMSVGMASVCKALTNVMV